MREVAGAQMLEPFENKIKTREVVAEFFVISL